MGYVILESTEYPAMSGSNTICVATVLLETGILPMTEPTTELTLESPAGLITVSCRCRDGKVEQVRFVNQPAFCYYLDAEIEVPDLGRLTVDVAYGGMTYVLVEAAASGIRADPGRGPEDLRARPGDQEGRGRAAGGGASDQPGDPRDHPGRVHRPPAARG